MFVFGKNELHYRDASWSYGDTMRQQSSADADSGMGTIKAQRAVAVASNNMRRGHSGDGDGDTLTLSQAGKHSAKLVVNGTVHERNMPSPQQV
jgi:hypothetical protein